MVKVSGVIVCRKKIWNGYVVLFAEEKPVNRIREDTVLMNYPLYCPKCRRETLIEVKNLQITVITEPDAQTQS